MTPVFLSIVDKYLKQYIIYNTKFVQKFAFTYRNGLLSMDTIKHF